MRQILSTRLSGGEANRFNQTNYKWDFETWAQQASLRVRSVSTQTPIQYQSNLYV